MRGIRSMHSAWILVRHLTVSDVILQHKLCNCGVSGCLLNKLVQGLLIESKAEGSIRWSKLAPTGVLSPQGYPGVLCKALVFHDVYY